jgi:NAD(P)-dependent dehydrogenase (short-subunit alcohol dehydrogenase family)
MVGSRDLPPSTVSFGTVFFQNQFRAKPQWPAPGTSLSGQTAIVTGSNTGLGYEASVQLLELGLSHIILGVRSLERGEAAAAKMRQLHPKAKIEAWELDMSSYPSVQAFARRCEILQHIDIVILNAGLTRMTFHTCATTGHEELLQVNYISTVLLAVLLLPVLRAKARSRRPPHLTIVSAALTLAAKFQYKDYVPLLPAFDDPQLFHREETYNSSKVLAHCFLWHLCDYVSGNDVIVNLADPAWVRGTDLTRDVEGCAMKLGVKAFGALTGRHPRVGASCFVDAVVNKGKESHGCFLMSWKIHPCEFPSRVCAVLLLTPIIDSLPTYTRPRAGGCLSESGMRHCKSSTSPVFVGSWSP